MPNSRSDTVGRRGARLDLEYQAFLKGVPISRYFAIGADSLHRDRDLHRHMAGLISIPVKFDLTRRWKTAPDGVQLILLQ